MEPLTAGLFAGGMVGSSLLGGLMGSKGSGDLQREAMRRQVELGKNQAMITSQLMAPYVGYGQLAAGKLWGYGGTSGPGMATGPTGQGLRYLNRAGGGGSVSIPQLTSTGTKWKSPTSIGYSSYGITGPGVDRTGGAGQTIPQLQALINSARTPGVETQQFIDQLKNFGSNFKFNENDPVYQYRKKQSRKDIDTALASRGLFDSRVGLNMLTEGDERITADEVDKQYGRGYQTVSDLFKMTGAQDEAKLGRNVTDYNRQYGGLADLFNMKSKVGETTYQGLLDAVKVGSGAGASAGSMGNAAAGNLMSAYGQMAATGAQDDANRASLYSSIGAMPINAMTLYKLLGSGGAGGSAYAPQYTDLYNLNLN